MNHEQLLPAWVLKGLPPLGATEGHADPICQVKFFYPDFSWSWYAIEFDGDDLFFGFVSGFERELGYFRLSELLENRGKLGMEIERDGSFRPTPLSKLKRL